MKPSLSLIETLIGNAMRSIQLLLQQSSMLADIAQAIIVSIQNNGTIYFCGNGGSAADAQHLAAEFVGRFEKERKALPAIALTTDNSILTAIANDYGFGAVFERQVEALVRANDVVIGISTSGTSPNVMRALRKADQIGARAILFASTRCGVNRLKAISCADLVLTINSNNTARIQEAHMVAGHIVCYLVEQAFCEKDKINA